MSRFWSMLCCGCVSAVLTACRSDLDRTHDASLLDDKVTTQRILAALGRAGPELGAVKVNTTNGVSVLSGFVPTDGLRERAEAIARQVHRATRVDDQIQIRRTAAP